MPRFFYTERSHKQYEPPENLWRRFLKYRQKKKTQAELANFSKLRNPYRRQEKPQKKPIFLPLFLLFIFIVWLGIMIYLPYFQIKKISFSGLKTIKSDKIQALVNGELNGRPYLPKRNYFLLNDQNIARSIRESLPINSINITKIFPNELKITVEEKISSIVYDDGKNYWLLDENGSAMENFGTTEDASFIAITATNTTSTRSTGTNSTSTVESVIHTPEYEKITINFGAYPILFDTQAPDKIELKQNVLSKDIITAVITASAILEKRGIGRLKYFIMESETAGLRVITDNNFEILLSFFNSIEGQLANAETILRSNQPSEYVDVRFGERVFWK